MPTYETCAMRKDRDPAERVALVVAEKRNVLLRAYRGRLREEDLEDCYSQAALEIVLRSRRPDGEFASPAHIANALEQKFQSRICDRRRSLSGRNAIETALDRRVPLGDHEAGGIDLPDSRTDTERMVTARIQLQGLIRSVQRLSADQRLVLASRLQADMSPSRLCKRLGWSQEKYRKVDQRGRAKLRKAMLDLETM